jgi:predicted transcriptional regulator
VSDSAILMSIRPVYSEAIFTGQKTVELRRRRPAFAEGTTVLVYSSAPDQVVRGTFRTGAVVNGPPCDLWARVGARAAISRADFDAYFAGCETAYAIEVSDPREIEPTALSVRPPQSYLILRSEDHRHADLLALVAEATRGQQSLPGQAFALVRNAAHRLLSAAAVATPLPASSD